MDMAVLGRLFLFHQQICLNVADFFRRLVTLQYASVARDKEFSEVPFDIGLLVVIGILLTHHLVHKLALLVARVKTAKALLCFQEGVERMLVGSIHLNLIELWKLDVEVGRAERVNLLNGTRSLFAKLVAREIENLKAVLSILLV